MDLFYGIDGHDIKYTMTTNIDVEHISTTSVQFNYFLLLFNYYASILFVDVRFFHSDEKSAPTEVE